jgi:Tfp pilus assembly major pilin PilA
MKKSMEEQLSSLDIHDEIESRPRRKEKARSPDIGQAIIIAAVILVVGIWGGKLVNDYLEEQRLRQALEDISKEVNHAFGQSERQTQAFIEEMEQNRKQAAIAREKERINRQRAAEAATAQKAKEQRLKTPECQFWTLQQQQAPSERNSAQARRYCGE